MRAGSAMSTACPINKSRRQGWRMNNVVDYPLLPFVCSLSEQRESRLLSVPDQAFLGGSVPVGLARRSRDVDDSIACVQ